MIDFICNSARTLGFESWMNSTVALRLARSPPVTDLTCPQLLTVTNQAFISKVALVYTTINLAHRIHRHFAHEAQLPAPVTHTSKPKPPKHKLGTYLHHNAIFTLKTNKNDEPVFKVGYSSKRVRAVMVFKLKERKRLSVTREYRLFGEWGPFKSTVVF